jgi:hypothetical protein
VTIDEILDRCTEDLRSDFTAYRHHAHRVAALCESQAGGASRSGGCGHTLSTRFRC